MNLESKTLISSVNRSTVRVMLVRTLLEYITHVVVDSLGQVFEVFTKIMEFSRCSMQEATLKQVTITVNDRLEL